MATKTFEELKQLAIQIRDEKTNKQNTATRVGTAMLEHINKLEQDYYDKTQTDEELKERDDKLTELGTYKLSLTKSKFINSIGGVSTAASDLYACAEDLLPVIPNTEYTTNCRIDTNWYGAFYDENGNFISTFQNSQPGSYAEWKFVTPVNCYNIRLSHYGESIDGLYYGAKEAYTEYKKSFEYLDDKIKYKESINNSILCLGDSLIMGAGSDVMRYANVVLDKYDKLGIDTTNLRNEYIGGNISLPYALSQILPTYNIENLGVGGENINAIAARMGANPPILTSDITLPSNSIDKIRLSINSCWNESINFTGQAGNKAYNPCYTQGIEYEFTIEDGSYYIRRIKEAEKESKIPSGTQLIMRGAKFRNPKAAIIWAYQNGGYSSPEDLVDKMRKIVDNIGTSNYIIIGLHTSSTEERKQNTDALQKEFGDRFFDWGRYVSSNALYDFGITPTKDSDFTETQIEKGVKSDEYQMSIGALPSTLWRFVAEINSTTNDSTHLNAAGYMILAYKIYERLLILNSFVE